MSDPGKPRIRPSIQLVQHDELNAELSVISDDEAASLLWAAQWLDEHREYAVTAIRLDDTTDPDDEEGRHDDACPNARSSLRTPAGQTRSLAARCTAPSACENFLYGFKAARRAA